MEKEHFIMLMEIFIQGNGIMTKQMDLEYIDNQTVLFMKVIGKMTFSMEKDKRNVYLIIKERD